MSKPKQKDSFWFSKISSYQDCPRKYKHQYIDFTKIDRAQSGDLLFGSAIHYALEELLKGNEKYLEVFCTYWDMLQDDDIEYGRYGWEYLRSYGIMLLKKFNKQYMKHIQPVAIEERIYGSINGHKYEGTFDLYGYYKGVPSLIDFKTSHAAYDKDKIIVAEQLEGYSYLCRQQKPPLVPEQIIYFVLVKSTGSVQKPLIYPLTEESLEASMKNTELWIERIKADTDYPMNKSACIKGKLRCPYFEVCHGRKKI